MKIIETERLILRVPTLDDFDELYSVHANPETNIFNPGWEKPSREEFLETLNTMIDHHKKHGFGYYALVDKADNRVFGLCGLRFTTINDKKYLNLYYRIDPSKMRRGFVKEAATKIIDIITSELNNEYKVVALTLNKNIPSRKTAESLGLKYNRDFDDLGGEGNVYYFS
ncbi:GNAT family N-acetyltransferase [Mediannikoviicoccus vaginalis]|uniref:GNAT family N-acetyltransferase n=1 Tax=Mediannikoviicoccus vaginalis TaxID=2899727 RepID=UPI001F21BFFD|nr:GNAT family N-acetyltransferase [Mediannikoviicoccus vaginalis]